MTDLISLLVSFIPILATFIFSLLSIVAVVVVTGVSSYWPGRMFHYLMLLIVGSGIGAVLLSERVLRADEYGLSISSDADLSNALISKLFLILVIGCSLSLCVGRVFLTHKNKRAFFRFKSLKLAAPTDIIISFMFFYMAYSIFPLMFIEGSGFHVSLIYPFIVFLALFLWIQLSQIDPVIVIKQCLGLITFGSLVFAIFLPELTTQPGYRGLVPGFDIRLWGLTSHANNLGAIACIFLVLEAAEPSSRKWVRNCILAAATVALIMTQSKTSILAAILGLLTIAIWRLVVFIKESNISSVKNNNSIGIFLVTLFVLPPVVLGVWLLFSDLSLTVAVERELNQRAVGDLETASGRDVIWQYAVESGLGSPVFGSGIGFWEKIRLMPGMHGASHAHNQFLQVFSRSGFVGLIALTILLFLLLRYSLRAAINTRGGSVALMVLFLTRAMFEVPIQPNSILGGEFIALMGLLIYTIDRGAKPIIKTQEIDPAFTNLVKSPGSK